LANVVTNTGGGYHAAGGSFGCSLELRRTQFSNFSGSFSGAHTGVRLSGEYTFGNVFTAVDVEEVTVGLATRGETSGNSFIGGTLVADQMFDCTDAQSRRTVVDNAHFATNRPDGQIVLGNTTGVILRDCGS